MFVIALSVVSGCARNPRPMIAPFSPQDLATGWTVIGAARDHRTGQHLVAVRAHVQSIDVAIVTGNQYGPSDVVALTVETPSGQVLARSAQRLLTGTNGWVRFPLTVVMPAGTELVVRLSEEGGTIFGWRYRVNAQGSGRSIMLGRNDGRWDFLYRMNQ